MAQYSRKTKRWARAKTCFVCKNSSRDSTYSAWHEQLHSTAERKFDLLPLCAKTRQSHIPADATVRTRGICTTLRFSGFRHMTQRKVHAGNPARRRPSRSRSASSSRRRYWTSTSQSTYSFGPAAGSPCQRLRTDSREMLAQRCASSMRPRCAQAAARRAM